MISRSGERSMTAERRIPSLYSLPGLTHVVGPSLRMPAHSWMCPWSESTGRKRSIANLTAREPAGASSPISGFGGSTDVSSFGQRSSPEL
jgi:hypothetical protein